MLDGNNRPVATDRISPYVSTSTEQKNQSSSTPTVFALNNPQDAVSLIAMALVVLRDAVQYPNPVMRMARVSSLTHIMYPFWICNLLLSLLDSFERQCS